MHGKFVNSIFENQELTFDLNKVMFKAMDQLDLVASVRLFINCQIKLFFVRRIPKVSQVDIVLRAES